MATLDEFPQYVDKKSTEPLANGELDVIELDMPVDPYTGRIIEILKIEVFIGFNGGQTVSAWRIGKSPATSTADLGNYGDGDDVLVVDEYQCWSNSGYAGPLRYEYNFVMGNKGILWPYKKLYFSVANQNSTVSIGGRGIRVWFRFVQVRSEELAQILASQT